MAMNPMLATLLTASMNKGSAPGGPGSIVDSLMSVLNGGDVDGVLKGIGFAGLMKDLPRVMNSAMDWKSMQGGSPGDMETPEDEGAAEGQMGPMGMGGMPMPPMPMPPGMPGPGGPAPGGNPLQGLMMALAAAKRSGLPPAEASGPGALPPLGNLVLRR